MEELVKDHCLSYRARDNIRSYKHCNVTFQTVEISNGDRVEACPICFLLIEEKYLTVRCKAKWWVCPKCYPRHCNVYMNREPELGEAKVGKIVWLKTPSIPTTIQSKRL
jgi:hypothetical protein